VLLETKVGKEKLLISSMYFDINRPIDYDLQKMQAILMHANGLGIVFAVDRKARSTSCHDVLTNTRGKAMEEFLISRQQYIANEKPVAQRSGPVAALATST